MVTGITHPISSSNGQGSSKPSPSQQLCQSDVMIAGGGLAGSLAAVVLGRAGHRVALIDRHAAYPPDFRVEKIGGDQIELLRRLGLLDSVAAVATPFNHILNVHRGHVIDQTHSQHFGILYDDLVKLVRAQLPPAVEFIHGRIVDIAAGPERQRVSLADGREVDARLIVLATGMGDALRHKLDIRRRVVFEKHSLSFGFSLAPVSGEDFAFPALTCYGEQTSDCIDYLSLFPVGNVMRVNLFTFRDHRDPWARDLRREPKAALLAALPGLERYLGDLRVTGRVQNWLMDLQVAENYRRAGVVLIGDAFQTSCPAAGTGVSRLLTDVEQLCQVHLPRWIATPGMSAEKIAAFYDDPEKRAADMRSARLAEYRRLLTVDTGVRWRLQRRQHFLRRRVVAWVRQFKGEQPPLRAGAGRRKI